MDIKTDYITLGSELLKQLGVMPIVVEAFNDRGEAMKSEGGFCVLYTLTDKEQDKVKELEAKGDCVYHVIRNCYDLDGDKVLLTSYLVLTEEDLKDPEPAKDDLKEGLAFSWTENESCPDFSEYGTIGVAGRFGGVARLY